MRQLSPQEVITVLSAQYATAVVERDTAFAKVGEQQAKIEELAKRLDALEHPAPPAPEEIPTQ